MEALGLLLGIRSVLELRFHTYSQQLMHKLTAPDSPVSEDWRAYFEIMNMSCLLAQHKGFRCVYIPHEHNSEADVLAHQARITDTHCEGYTNQTVLPTAVL